jgi:hypothetical protein
MKVKEWMSIEKVDNGWIVNLHNNNYGRYYPPTKKHQTVIAQIVKEFLIDPKNVAYPNPRRT